MACMNYLELLNAFYERVQCSRVSNNGQLLYHTLLMINNKSSWSDWFSRTNVSISGMMNISEKAFINARSELKQLGLIDFVPSKKRGECTKYCILYPTKYSTKEGTNDSTKGGSKEVQNTVQSADIVKLKQKTKTKKSVSNDTPEKCVQNSAGAIPQDTLDQYIASMEALGKPMTPSGLEMLFKRLEQLAPGDAKAKTEIMEQTIRNGWKDVYPLKRDDEERREKPNRFHNFEQRNTDYNAIVLERLNERLRAENEEEG
jgi:hypothetical protein